MKNAIFMPTEKATRLKLSSCTSLRTSQFGLESLFIFDDDAAFIAEPNMSGHQRQLTQAEQRRPSVAGSRMFCGVARTLRYCTLSWLLAVSAAFAGDKVELAESASDSRPFRVSIRMELDGQVQAAVGETKSIAMKLTGNAKLTFDERRLSSLGRDAADFRAVRHYEQAEFHSQVADRVTDTKLRPELRQIIAEGQPDGLRMYSPLNPLTYDELELIRPPLDSLTAVALLPPDRVEVGEKWETPIWAVQFLTAMEAVEKSALTCTLESVTDDVAKVTLKGEIKGGFLGATSEIKLTGHYLYDLKEHYLKSCELTQMETRSVGAVTPGLKVTAKASLERHPENSVSLTDEVVAGVAREPLPGALLLAMDAADWGIKVYHERLWHLFHQGSTVAVLRLMEKGSLIAQCNVTPIGPAPAGKHIGEQQFQEDIQKAIGADFQRIEKAEIIPTQDQRFVFRVIASGEASQKTAKGVNKIPVNWIYYLVANPDGRQMVLVFTVETALLERLQSRDVNLALGIDFVPKAAK